MITSVEITNFKSLKNVRLETRNLNLLTGLNGSGKSSLIQVFLLLGQSAGERRKGRLLLKGSLFDAGVAEDVYYQFGVEKEIYFGFTVIDADGEEHHLTWHYGCDPLVNPNANVLDAPERYTGIGYTVSWPFIGFNYLTAERIGPQNSYAKNVSVVEDEYGSGIGLAGEYAVHFLNRYGDEYKVANPSLQHPDAKSDILIHQVDAWMSEIAPGVQLYTEEISNEEVRLSFQFGTGRGKTNMIKPKNVGFGLTYVLPVILSLLTAEPGNLILIENPESHIHPRGQVELGRLLAGCAQSGAQLFVETHSDHILNGLRVAVKEGLIDSDKAVAFYFKRESEDNSTDITPIVIDTNGKLHRQTVEGTTAQLPKGFFDQWTSSMAKLF